MNIPYFSMVKLKVSSTNLKHTLSVIEKAIAENKNGYICVTNSRTSYLANYNENYCIIQNNSLLTVPDGMPLVWIAHNMGLKDVQRVSGPDLMEAIFKISVKKNYSHFFYGSTPQTINQLKINLEKKYSGLLIKGEVSPPFQALEKFDINGLAKEINLLKPTFFWCGLGAPKQEMLNALLQPKLESTICIGVGLAFEYLAGTVKRAPIWMQRTGMEWLFRLAQQPYNINRAILPFSWIMKIVIFTYIKKLTCRKDQSPSVSSKG